MTKFNDNLIISASIKDYRETYELGCLIDNQGKYTNPWLSFNSSVDAWNASDYLYNKLLPALHSWKNNIKIKEHQDELEEVKVVITESDFSIVLELLEKGEELGFFDEFKK